MQILKPVVNNSQYGSSIYRNLEYFVPNKLDVDSIRKAAKYFEGEHDFKGFKATGGNNKNTIRTIYNVNVEKQGERIVLEFTGNGFLYNMVRIISGTLLEVGLGKIKPEEIPNIIESKDRTKAGKTLPPYALYLVKVEYE